MKLNIMHTHTHVHTHTHTVTVTHSLTSNRMQSLRRPL